MNKEIHHEGWLIKSPPTKRIWRARWRRRWFTLKQGEIPGQFCLEYYTDRNCRKLKGIIDLDQCEQVDSGLRLEHRKQKFQYMFDIKTPRRTYYLAADTEKDMRDWVNCICQVCNLHDFTKQSGERQYYNLCEESLQSLNDSTSYIEETSSVNFSKSPSHDDPNQQQQQQQLVQSVVPDLIRQTGSMTIHSKYQNNDLPYVNTEYSNRETMKSQSRTIPSLSRPVRRATMDQPRSLKLPVSRAQSLHGDNFQNNESMSNVSSPISPGHTRSQSLVEQSTVQKTITNSSGFIKKIPENLVLSDTVVSSDSVEPSPALSTCSGPYIPISECFSGSPKFLSGDNPTTPLNNLDPKFYDTPRSHNNIGLNLTNDQSYSPKIYNCPQQMRPRSGRSSPTDSESVFTDDEEWSHPLSLRESVERSARPSDSSMENEAIVLTYSQRFSKIPGDGVKCEEKDDEKDEDAKEIDKSARRRHKLVLQSDFDDEKNRETIQLSDTENTSPAIGPKDASCSVEESYDIPRSHNLPYYNMYQFNSDKSPILSGVSTPNLNADMDQPLLFSPISSSTLPRPHFYSNAAPTVIEGNVFRYDFMEQPDAPKVNRSLKPKLSLPLEAVPKLSNSAHMDKCIITPPSIDRKLKPPALKESQFAAKSLRRKVAAPVSLCLSSETDFAIDHKDRETLTLPRNPLQSLALLSSKSPNNNSTLPAKSDPILQYFDLDVANPPKQIGLHMSTPKPLPSTFIRKSKEMRTLESGVVYNSVDFRKTEAFKTIREAAEKKRKEN